MREMGYDGIQCGTKARYGEAIFWQTDLFRLHKRRDVRFDDLVKQYSDQLDDKQLLEAGPGLMKLGTDRHGLLAQLELLHDSRRIIVATTHLWTSRTRNSSFLRIVQLQKLFAVIEEERKLAMSTVEGKVNAVICGDFNSTDTSPVYRFTLKGTVDSDETDVKDWPAICSPQNSEGVFSHPFVEEEGLTSAYRNILGQEPRCRRYQGAPSSVIEYIFSTQPAAGVCVPDSAITAHQIPTRDFASDHVPIVALFD